ncbi:MAG: acyl-CoA dehydrogenase family protein [Rhodothermia bacterium]|nr:acyl-CoA dehydrogenase family protein [Rhodothermia bacterium]
MKSPYFTEEHEMFRSTIQDFLTKEAIPHFKKWEEAGQIDREIFQKMGEMGFFGLDAPEEYGGLGTDFMYTAIFLHELGRAGNTGFATAVTTHAYLAMNYLIKGAAPHLKEKYLAPSVRGELLGALAMTEPFAGSDLKALRSTAVLEGDHYIVNGSKTFITNGHYCDYFVTAVKMEKGISMLVIDRNTPGVTTSKLQKIGMLSSDTAEIAFDNVRVPVENLLGEEGKGFYYMMESLQTERLTLSHCNMGLMERAIDLTLQYMNERQAFGQSINKFQALRHRMADIASEVEAYKQFINHTSWLFGHGEQVVKECSMLKLRTSELLKKVVDECLQMFGGYGFMEEYEIARMYRDVRVIPIYAGTSEIMREIIAKIIIDGHQYKSAYKGA